MFCKIIARQASAEIFYQDDRASAFQDIHPVAPIHILIVPNKHIASINEIRPEDEAEIGHLFDVARMLAEKMGIQGEGYRLIINTGANAGQAVFHLHVHLIGGRRMRYPMG
jgi:histidine triad (HIT) family protein